MLSLQEYQHVHLLCFKKRCFTLVWKPNPPLRSISGAHLCARADAASESTMGACCSRSAYAPLLRCLCSAYACGETGVNQALLKRSRWKHLSSRDQWNLTPATMCCGSAARAVWSRGFGAAQTMHSHKCDHVKYLLAHSQKMVANAACGFFMYHERSLERLSSSGTWTIISSYLLLFIAWNKHEFFMLSTS